MALTLSILQWKTRTKERTKVVERGDPRRGDQRLSIEQPCDLQVGVAGGRELAVQEGVLPLDQALAFEGPAKLWLLARRRRQVFHQVESFRLSVLTASVHSFQDDLFVDGLNFWNLEII